MEIGVVAIGVNPGRQEDVEKTSFCSSFRRGVPTIFPVRVGKSVVETHFSVMAFVVLALQEDDEKTDGQEAEESGGEGENDD